MTIRPPAQIDWLVAAVGAEAAFRFIECAGGRRVWVPRKWEGSDLAGVYGDDIAKTLSHHFGGEQIDVPICRPWRILMCRQMGLSVDDIAARTGTDRSTVKKALARGPHIPALRKAWQTDPGQLSLL